MLGLVDNDAIIKLCKCGLMSDALAALGITQTCVLPSAEHRIVRRPSRRMREIIDDETKARITSFLGASEKLELGAEHHDFIAAYEDVDGVDSGELTLLSGAWSMPDSLLLTNDRKFLLSLAGDERTHGLIQHMTGQFVYLPQVLLMLMDRMGYPALYDRVLPICESDNGYKLIFSTGEADAEAHARNGLISYAAEIRNALGDLLYPQ